MAVPEYLPARESGVRHGKRRHGMASSRRRRRLVARADARMRSEARRRAERPERVRFPRYERVSLTARADYFEVSCRPITKRAEDDMEMLSDVVTWGERFLAHWQPGVYACARCDRALYHSKDKWSGPCVWPSWRRPVAPGAISTSPLTRYNSYTCAVAEVYCAGCELFLGHMFEDAIEHGDMHADARWRH